jgi:Fe2+ transport system protein FeoA
MSLAIPTKPLVQNEHIPLHRLSPGGKAKIYSVRGTNHEIARLAEMGLRSGTIVSVTRGGITSIVEFLSGSRLCVRTSKKLEILVTPL